MNNADDLSAALERVSSLKPYCASATIETFMVVSALMVVSANLTTQISLVVYVCISEA